MPGMSTDNNGTNTSGVALPAYVLLRPEGVFINLSPRPGQEILQMFTDRMFSNESRFAGLDYSCFLYLLYGIDPTSLYGKGETEVRLASSIVRFPPERMALYKGVKILNNGERAEYMFEPAFIEGGTGGPDEDGGNTGNQAAQLDFDEFVASMWIKGVRCGIAVDAVRDAINKGGSTRMDIARQVNPTDSKDAEVIEESDLLHQDNAPMILPNGKADLRRARNRFPQVGKNTPLLRKIPRSLGKPGYRVTGTIIEPRKPEDLDLSKLAGEGTRIDQSPKGELLVANIDGFIDMDEGTGMICVVTKIEDKGGISTKKTGDIKLTVDDFTEHGEVQEGRVVEGKHMTFRADVFGTIISQGGDIEFGGRLSGGRAQSIGGNITVKGKTLNATVEAWDGKISIEFAEDTLIMGKSIAIARAVGCKIVAEELQLGIAEGCAIAGKNIQITASTAHKNRETVISIVVPDIAGYNRQIAEAKKNLAQIEQAIQAKNREIAAHQSDPGFAKYLAMEKKVHSGEIKFTPEQQAGWQKIVKQFAPIVGGTENLKKKCELLEDAIERWTQERASCGAGEHCKIGQVSGDTIVRTLGLNHGLSALRELPQEELNSKLQELGDAQDRIFWESSGSLDWKFTIPAIPSTPE